MPEAPTPLPAQENNSGPLMRRTGPAFSEVRLSRLRRTLQKYVESGQLPGLVLLVSHRDRVHAESLGHFTFDGGPRMRRDTIFRLASMTKPITAAAAMTLVEECRLRLDDPVDEWLPELSRRRVLRDLNGPLDDTVPARRSITLRDLLTFRSGYGEVLFLAPQSPLQKALAEARLPLSSWPFAASNDEFLKRLGGLPLAHQPGERWLYHMSAEILGVLISRVSGQPLSTFLQERLFEPLGMTDTGFQVSEARRSRLPTCYGSDYPRPDLIVLDPPQGLYAQKPVFESGAGGLVSTVDDMLAFGRMWLPQEGGNRPRVLSRPTIELMTQDQLTPEQKAASPFFPGFWEGYGWGLGLAVVTRRQSIGENPGRFGWDGAFGTSWGVDPKEQLVAVLMTQRRPDVLALPPVVRDFWTSVYQLIEE